MNRVRHFHASRVLLSLAAWFLLTECYPLAQEPGPNPEVSTDPADKVACKRQLNRITGAIREYRQDHEGRLPDRLADLYPDYIHDLRVFVCPYVRNQGGLRGWNRRTADFSEDAYSSYHYEFAQDPMRYYWRGLPKKTLREVKTRQQELWGGIVPIVRCHTHDPRLNLSVAGPIYESRSDWENKIGITSDYSMNLANLFPSPEAAQPRTPAAFPPRDPRAPPQVLDLTAYYNATLTSSWQGFSGLDLASLPTDIQIFDGVLFDVRGVIQLCGLQLPVKFPWRVDGIRVFQKCDKIHFLHAISWIFYPTPQARYWIHYADGDVQEITVINGQHIADWWQKPGSTNKVPVAWSGQNEATKAYGMEVRLYHMVWDNPRKDVEIESISFDATDKPNLSGPFVVAITLE